ncbi:hypothetical protein AV654_19385 [Paenibacillus elgii]|uniref:Uncharacterized protein n=1 Tax=Paenibacillus elgii TaxID=189691 RepID=A0A163XMS2_9BACL|nr:hypothetical protein [Paenibacillus elgii]KZE78140.1 hypothetical protein AV654_19385 [Paenibacillus elgii]
MQTKRNGRKPRPIKAIEQEINKRDDILNKMLVHIISVTQKNEAELLREWIVGAFKETGVYQLKIGDQDVYFVRKEEMEDAAAFVKEYQKKGLIVDDQLIQYLCEKNNGIFINP